MQNQQDSNARRLNFRLILTLTALFFLLQVVVVWQQLPLSFSGAQKAHVFSWNLFLSPKLVLDGLRFLAGVLITHALWGCYLFYLTERLRKLLKWHGHAPVLLTLGLFSLSVLTILLANQYFFPHSRFALLPIDTWHSNIAPTLRTVIAVMLNTLIGLHVLGLLAILFGSVLSPKYRLATVSVSVVALVAMFLHGQTPAPRFNYQKPNIILIGMDSLRRDRLQTDRYMPNLYQFIQHSTQFTHAYTPIARTFPAWFSILTGQYPSHHGARFNLTSPTKLNPSASFARVLREAGYNTVFATDERRFSHIDHSYGFNQVIAPKMGVDDLLLTNANDLPLSNLVANNFLGRWFFPYSFMNRAAAKTYDPRTFTNHLGRALDNKTDKPLFLAVHFCLTHWPYHWAQSLDNIHLPIKFKPSERYQQAVYRLDQQFSDFIELLHKRHILDHAIVVTLSDHGESLGLANDMMTQTFATEDQDGLQLKPFLRTTYGHGTDVLSESQYHVELNFRGFGISEIPAQKLRHPASLIDIKPTLLDFIQVKSRQVDGLSLRPMITGQKVKRRILFFENGLTLPAMLHRDPNVRKVIEESLPYFKVDSRSGQIEVNEAKYSDLLLHKQYAALQWPWLLAHYPSKSNVLLNLESKQWTLNPHSPLAQTAPFKQLNNALKRMYGAEMRANQKARLHLQQQQAKQAS